MRTILALVVLSLSAATAAAQINLPEQADEHTIVAATLAADIPDGAEIQGGWAAKTLDFAVVDPQTIHLTGPPGVHSVSFRGAWVATEEVSVGDQTIHALIGFGFLDYSAEITIGPAIPPPDPMPTPPGTRWGIIIEETKERTPAQAALWVQIRRQASLNRILIVDQDSQSAPLAPFLAAARDKPLPQLVVVATVRSDDSSADVDKIVRVVSVPVTVAGLIQEINQ